MGDSSSYMKLLHFNQQKEQTFLRNKVGILKNQKGQQNVKRFTQD